MKIALDIDNTINSNAKTIKFFSLLTGMFDDIVEIFIITNRDPESYENTQDELFRMGICYDYLFLTADKAKVILEKDIDIVFEDTDEYFVQLPESVVVFKIREDGNFDFSDGKWIYGDKTGKKI